MRLILIFRRSITRIFVLFALSISFSAGAFSMFDSKHKPSSELYEILQNVELTNKHADTNGFNLKNLYIDKARIKGAIIRNFSVSNTDLKNFDARNSIWENGEFTDVNFNDVYFDEVKIKNVTFRKSIFTKANFISGQFENVEFIDCTITQSVFYYLINSDITFINTKIYDNEYKFSDSQIKMRLINSEFRDTDMMSLKEGSSIYVENSVIDNVCSGLMEPDT